MGHDYVFSSGSWSQDNQNLMQLQLIGKYELQQQAAVYPEIMINLNKIFLECRAYYSFNFLGYYHQVDSDGPSNLAVSILFSRYDYREPKDFSDCNENTGNAY